MSSVAVLLLLAATAPPPKPVVAHTYAVASVQIIAGEEVRFEDIGKADPKTAQRQTRVRRDMPMVEFY